MVARPITNQQLILLSYNPAAKGTLTIGSASVQVGGKTLHSRSVTINITGTPGKSQTANAATSSNASSAQVTADGPINSRDLFITVTPSRRRVFRQEAILLTYRVHSAVDISLQNVMMSSKPEFQGLGFARNTPLYRTNKSGANQWKVVSHGHHSAIPCLPATRRQAHHPRYQFHMHGCSPLGRFFRPH